MLLNKPKLLYLLCFLVELVVGQVSNTSYGSNESYIITWNDIKMDLWRDSMSKTEIKGRDNWNISGIIIVDQTGKTGHSVSVQGAIDMVPHGNSHRVKIFILPGIYREKVVVPSSKAYISLIGMENQTEKTVITWNSKASDKNSNGLEFGTFGSATISIFSNYFCASYLTFQNTVVAVAGVYGMQAVALRVSSQKAMFYKVNILGAQDTLLDETGSHYFYNCLIQGSIDFIFGNAKSLYRDCVIHSIANESGAIAAHHRNSIEEDTGFSFINCTINGSGKIYLGRAWGPYSTTLYSYCDIDDMIAPAGWSDWNQPDRQNTTTFGEFSCKGRGADTRWRVPWAKSFSIQEAEPFLNVDFIDGNKWLRL